MEPGAQVAFTPGRLGPVELRNRVVKCATNEGMSRDGCVTDRLIAWHREFAAGGVGMTTLAYCSVAPGGRTFPHQIVVDERALPGLRRFARAIHDEGALAAIQLGHAGWFANPKATGCAPMGPSRSFSPFAQTFSRAMTEDDFAATEDAFAEAARLSVAAGFDALEVHVGHGYLLSQFLSPYNNRRRDRFGGDIEARARFPRQVLRRVRDAAGPDVAVYAKLNMNDGFDKGLQLHDGIQVARWLETDGSVDALQLTGGHTTKSPMYLMRGEVPLREMIELETDRFRRWGMRLFAPMMLKRFEFEEAFFLPLALEFRRAVELPLMLLGGITSLANMARAMDEGFEFVAMGRALISEPDLIQRIQAGETDRSRCVPCNRCVVEMDRDGTRCVLQPAGDGNSIARTPG